MCVCHSLGSFYLPANVIVMIIYIYIFLNDAIVTDMHNTVAGLLKYLNKLL